MTAFASLALSPKLLAVVSELGFEAMTPIQAQAIPELLAGRDLIGQAKTGSGKTAAFSLPLLNKLHPRAGRPQGLVLCPTRELCAQVAREIRKLGRRLPGLQVLILSGGLPMRPQIQALEKGVHVVVGTPGRVLDHLDRGKLDLGEVQTVVLDEADRMLDMGFEPDMEAILAGCPTERQTVFFSATFPETIGALSRLYQTRPVRVEVVDAAKAESTIKQFVYELTPQEKLKALFWLLQRESAESAIVFCNLKATVVDVNSALVDAGMNAAAIHGDLEQRDRDQVMARFRNRSVRVLVATDVAARGIDVEGVDVVVNFDLPHKPEVYVHRIGRTGRAGKTGLAISFATQREQHKIEAIELATSRTIERGNTPALAAIALEDLTADLPKDARMVTLRIGAGRKDKLRPGDVLGALTGEAAGLDAALVGKIEIHDRFTYVAIAQSVAAQALQSLANGRIKGRRLAVEVVD